MADLTPVFQPESAAVYGASTSAGKLGNTLLGNLSASLSDVRCVHPTADLVDGVAAVPRLDQPVDLAMISVPAERAEAAVLDAVTGGARSVVVLSSGFGEAGEDGQAIQRRIVDIVREHRVPLIGPNCMGVLSQLPNGTCLNASYFWQVPTSPGGLSFVSQSGAFGGMFLSFLGASDVDGLGLARFISLGNAPDVSINDALQWLGEDEDTKVIGLFAEGIRDGREFVEVASEVAARKPVVVLKGGKSQAGARAAAGHTGSLAGDNRVSEAAFRRSGLEQAQSSGQFFDMLRSLSMLEQRETRGRVAIVTVSGGPGVLAADAVEMSSLSLPVLTPATQELIRRSVPAFAATVNPVDLTPQCPPDAMAGAIMAVYESGEVDGVVIINCGLDIAEFGSGVAAAVEKTALPTAAFTLDVPQVSAELGRAGVPRFSSPEAAVHALAAAIGRQRSAQI